MTASDAPLSGFPRSRALDVLFKVAAPILLLNLIVVAVDGNASVLIWGLNLAFNLVLAAAFVTYRRQGPKAAAVILALGFWLIATVIVYALGGPRSPGLFVYLPVVAIASLYWSRHAGGLLTLASALVVLSAIQLDANGQLPKTDPVSTSSLGLVVAGCLVVTAVLVALSLQDLATFRRELRRARHSVDRLLHQRLLDSEQNERKLNDTREQYERRLHTLERSHALGQLAGSVAHDFNNLIAVIVNATALLERRMPRDETSRMLVHEINDAAARSAQMARKLLALGRQRAAQRVPVRLAEVVTDLAHLLERLCHGRVTLKVEYPAKVTSIMADRLQLEQMLLNLTINARDAMPEGGVLRIGLYEHAATDGSHHVRLAVEDQGVGMDTETLAQIFEPFYTTREAVGGTGLGLCTVKAVVHDNDGSICVTSRLGQGTRFEIDFPIIEERQVPPEAEATKDRTQARIPARAVGE